MTIRTLVVVACAGLLVALPAEAKDRAAREAARKKAFAFLTEGAKPLRPNLTREAFADARCTREPEAMSAAAHGGRCFLFRMPPEPLCPVKFIVAVSPRGHVVRYIAADRVLKIDATDARGRPLSAEQRQALVQSMLVFSPRQLRRRASVFLARVYPYRQRAWRLRAAETSEDHLVEHMIRWEETKRPGVLAVYPNRVTVVLNPATGQVSSYFATCVSGEVREAPAFAMAQVERRVAASLHGWKITHNELSMMIKGGTPRPVWVLIVEKERRERLLLVDAQRGHRFTPIETLD